MGASYTMFRLTREAPLREERRPLHVTLSIIAQGDPPRSGGRVFFTAKFMLSPCPVGRAPLAFRDESV